MNFVVADFVVKFVGVVVESVVEQKNLVGFVFVRKNLVEFDVAGMNLGDVAVRSELMKMG